MRSSCRAIARLLFAAVLYSAVSSTFCLIGCAHPHERLDQAAFEAPHCHPPAATPGSVGAASSCCQRIATVSAAVVPSGHPGNQMKPLELALLAGLVLPPLPVQSTTRPAPPLPLSALSSVTSSTPLRL